MNPKYLVYVPICLVVLLFLKGIFIPTWASALELVAAIALLGVRWLFEPKIQAPISKDSVEERFQKHQNAIENLADQIKQAGAQLGTLNLKLGLRGSVNDKRQVFRSPSN